MVDEDNPFIVGQGPREDVTAKTASVPLAAARARHTRQQWSCGPDAIAELRGLRPSSPLPLREESHARRAPLINSSHPHNPVVNPTLATCRCHSHLSYLLYARTLGHADYSQKFEKLTSSCVFLRLTLLTLVLSGEG